METNLYARWNTLNARVELPMVAESARWGDVLNGAGVPYNPFTPAHWAFARVTLRNNMVNAVSRWIAVCRTTACIRPTTRRSSISTAARVPVGFNLTLTAGTGTSLLTLDGTDPRLPGGAVSPAVQTYAGPLTITSTSRSRPVCSPAARGVRWRKLEPFIRRRISAGWRSPNSCITRPQPRRGWGRV